MRSIEGSAASRWRKKFACAFRGWRIAAGEGSSYVVHLPVAAAVVALAAWHRVSPGEWTALTLAIALVLAAEMVNSALEQMAQAITQTEDPRIRDALDLASGAVLAAAAGAAIVGATVFFPRWLG